MPARRIFTPIRLIAVVLVLVPCAYLYPVVRYEVLTHQWESEIKRQQDPAELQAWACDLLPRYHTTESILIVNEKPPPGIPRSEFGPCVELINSSNGYYVQLAWGGGFLRKWGMWIGDTNLFCGSQGMWKPGVYFVRSPS